MGSFLMERITGIEPALKAWEALVLPLNYIRKAKKIYTQQQKNQYKFSLLSKQKIYKKALRKGGLN